MRTSLTAVWFLLASPACAQSQEDLRTAVADFVRAQTQSLPGRVSIKVDQLDTRIKPLPCTAPEIFLPPGGHLLGNTTVGIRCPENNSRSNGKSRGRTIYLPVHVSSHAPLLIVNKPLTQGHVMEREDFSEQDGELAQTDLLTDPAQVIGKILVHGIGSGQALRQDMLHPPYSVKQGQNVQLLANGAGFRISYEGRAMNNAASGQIVQVRTPSNHVVSGIVRSDGIVEIRP